MTSEQISCPFCGGEMSVVNDGILTSMPPIKVYTSLCRSCSARISVHGDDGEAKLRALDDRLMPDGMLWPRWKDGKKVRIGDEFTSSVFKSSINKVDYVTVGSDTFVASNGIRARLCACTRVVPDTQERIDADAVRCVCEYWGANSLTTPCSDCKKDSSSCRNEMTLDLLRRQRELDKKEMRDGHR